MQLPSLQSRSVTLCSSDLHLWVFALSQHVLAVHNAQAKAFSETTSKLVAEGVDAALPIISEQVLQLLCEDVSH